MSAIDAKRQKEVHKACLHAIKVAKKLGCDEARVVCSVERNQSVCAENGELNLAHVLWSQSFGIQILRDQKKGTASINTLSLEDIEHAIIQAKSLASFSVPDSYLGLVDRREANKSKLKSMAFMSQRSVTKTTLPDLKKLVLLGIKTITSDKRVSLDRFEASAGESYYQMMTSNGITRSEANATIDWDYLAMAVHRGQVGGMDYGGSFAYTSKDVAKLIRHDCRRFQQRVLDNLNPQRCPKYTGAVLLSPRVLDELLFETILYHCSGGQIMDGKSRWADKLDEVVSSELLTIVDDPWHRSLSGSTSFDGDGLATKKRALIQHGVLQTFYLDAYTARRLNTKVNATAGGPFNLIVSGGKTPLKSLLKHQDKLLLIDRFSGNLDPLTGDFSGVAKNSSLFKSGKRQSAVKETMIAGNVFDMMRNIRNLSKETEDVGGSYIAPYVLVDRVTVSG
jgi:PmbA protein